MCLGNRCGICRTNAEQTGQPVPEPTPEPEPERPAVPSNSKTRELYDELLERESDERKQFQAELKRHVGNDL